MVNVTKTNFIEQSNDFLDHLPTAAFVSLDEEMTGITVPVGSGQQRPGKDSTPGERWSYQKQVPERYSIVQLGICLFHRSGCEGDEKATVETASAAAQSSSAAEGRWLVRRYNFYMFPATSGGHRGPASSSSSSSSQSLREIVLNPATVAFLQRNHLSLDVWASSGVPYRTGTASMESIRSFETMSKKIREELIESPTAAHALSSSPSSVQEAVRRRVELKRSEDIEFHATAMAGLREWLDSPVPAAAAAAAAAPNGNGDRPPAEGADGDGGEEGSCFLLPACNSFLRRALYETIHREYPALTTETADGGRIRVWRLTPSEKRSRAERMLKREWEDLIVHGIGMWRIFHALSTACRGVMLDRRSVILAPSVDRVRWDDDTKGDGDGDRVTTAGEEKSERGWRRRIPLVVHNGFMDLGFLFTHFCDATLPKSWHDYKRLVHQHFPVVYDTKVLSTQYCHNCSTVETAAAAAAGATVAANPQNRNNNNNNNNGNNNNHNQNADAAAAGAAAATTATTTDLSADTRLGNLYDLLVRRTGTLLERVQTANNSNGVGASSSAAAAAQDQEHEAAYDAYMTGAAFLALCERIIGAAANPRQRRSFAGAPAATPAAEPDPWLRLLTSDDASDADGADDRRGCDSSSARSLLGRNLLYQPGMYTIDLEVDAATPLRSSSRAGESRLGGNSSNCKGGGGGGGGAGIDPLRRGLLACSTYRVGGIDAATTTRDIVRCLTGLTDLSGRRVHFEIVWVDDTTFLVAASHKPEATKATATARPERADVDLAGVAGDDADDDRAKEGTAIRNHNDMQTTFILKEHGHIILQALKQRFNGQEVIVTLEEHLRELDLQQQKEEERAAERRHHDEEGSSGGSDNERSWIVPTRRWFSKMYRTVSSSLWPYNRRKRRATDGEDTAKAPGNDRKRPRVS